MKSTDKPVNLERAAGVVGEGWGVRIAQVTPEREPIVLEILDRLERKTIEAERHHAAVLRLEGDLVEEASRGAQLATENGAAKIARGHARAALARVAKALEAFEVGSGSRDVVVVELGAAVRDLEAAVSQ